MGADVSADLVGGIPAEAAERAVELTRRRRHRVPRQMTQERRLFVVNDEFAVRTLESDPMGRGKMVSKSSIP